MLRRLRPRSPPPAPSTCAATDLLYGLPLPATSAFSISDGRGSSSSDMAPDPRLCSWQKRSVYSGLSSLYWEKTMRASKSSKWMLDGEASIKPCRSIASAASLRAILRIGPRARRTLRAASPSRFAVSVSVESSREEREGVAVERLDHRVVATPRTNASITDQCYTTRLFC